MKNMHVNSDLKNPVGWFENIIINDLMYHYRDDFYTEAQRLYKDKGLLIDYDDNSITYDYVVTEDGYPHKFRYTYADYFDRIVGIEKENSIALISSRLNDCTTREEKSITIENILNKLYYLIHLLKKKRKQPIRDFPVIASGAGTPIILSRVGAISPSTPELMCLRSGSTKIRGTGLVVCAVLGLPSGLIIMSQFP